MLVREKEALSARLVIAESRTGGGSANVEPKLTEKQAAPSGKADGSIAGTVPAPAPAPDPIAAVQPAAEQAVDTPDVPEEPAASNIPPEEVKVAVEGLKVFRKAGRNRMEVKFTLKNIDDGSEPISGYSFVVLKDEGKDPGNWFVFPRVDMASGKPAQIKGGRYFQISRFKTITFDTKEKVTPEQFKAATIMIYNKTGELMLEKDFSLNEDS
jgi:hypothetical protein